MSGKAAQDSRRATPPQATAPKASSNQNFKQSKKRNKRRVQEDAPTARNSDHTTDSPLPAAKRVRTTASSGALDPARVSNDAEANTTAPPLVDPPRVPPKLEASYEVTDINIISSTQIKPKVSKILEILSDIPFPVAPSTKPNVISMHAKGPVASKMITIVEIAKREITKAGKKFYQYNTLSQLVEEKKKISGAMNGQGLPIGRISSAGGASMERDDGVKEDNAEVDGEESCFETMKTPLERALEGRPKVRAVPVMTIYLSRIPIDILERFYGLVFWCST